MSGHRVDRATARIDQSRPLSFTFDRTSFRGYAGDTLASALLAQGVGMLARSFKYGRPRGINSEGLKRRGFDADRIAAIKRAYRTLYVAGLPLAEAKQQLAEQAQASDDVKALLQFIESGERPLQR